MRAGQGLEVEPGEEPVEALHRELGEELGVTVRLGDELRAPDPAGWVLSSTYVMRLWTAQVVEGEPAPLVEHDELRWLEPGDWLGVPWLDADVPIVTALVSALTAR